jgi:sphingomyelin phosphodiesterase
MFKNLFIYFVLISSITLGFGQAQQIKILSWNIFMIPPTIFKSCQCERAPLISATVKNWDADVIIFQEAFQKKVRLMIWDLIKDKYPYETGVPKSGFLKVHSGVWMVSKYPIEKQESIVYKSKKGSDGFAKKGATFIEVNMNGKRFQVIGTHVQSGSKYQDIRYIQFKQLIDELGNKYLNPNIPQFIGGDLNTDYQFQDLYKEMIRILDVMGVKHTGETFSCDNIKNSLGAKFFDPEQQILDYILVRNQHEKIAKVKEEIIYSSITAEPVCKKGFKALSDHNPVMAIIEWKN